MPYRENYCESEQTVLVARIGDVPGKLVFDQEGYYRGFINTNDTKFGGVMPGPDGTVAGVLLPDGTLQNPDGSKSHHTDPVQYLLDTVRPIKEKKYHISSLLEKQANSMPDRPDK